jgi:SAM-dependent methyltransferase
MVTCQYTEGIARYDGHAAWYDDFASTESFVRLREHVVALLGPGPGRCLDLGCGTGLALPLLAEAGWTMTGVDASAAQLARAEERASGAELLRADAHDLPFAAASFDAVVSVLTHTDFDDAAAAFAEAARVLRRDGAFVYAGVHPCFASPFAQPLGDGTVLLVPGYRRSGWETVSRYPDRPGIRSRVGVNHIPLSRLVTVVLEAGLTLTQFDEPREEDPPLTLALRAEKR